MCPSPNAPRTENPLQVLVVHTESEILNLDFQITFPLKFNIQHKSEGMTISSDSSSSFEFPISIAALQLLLSHHTPTSYVPSVRSFFCLLVTIPRFQIASIFLLLLKGNLAPRRHRKNKTGGWVGVACRSLNIYVGTYFNWIEGLNLSSLYRI